VNKPEAFWSVLELGGDVLPFSFCFLLSYVPLQRVRKGSQVKFQNCNEYYFLLETGAQKNLQSSTKLMSFPFFLHITLQNPAVVCWTVAFGIESKVKKIFSQSSKQFREG